MHSSRLALPTMSRIVFILSATVFLYSGDGILAAAPSASSCNSTVADLIVLVDISGSVLETIVLDRSFIRSVINGFPIDGKNLRMGFIIFSSVCKTLVPVEAGTSREAVLEALNKPWWPIWSTQLADCLDKIRTVDLQLMGHISRQIVVVLITDEQPDDINRTLAAIDRLQNQGAKFFMVLTVKPGADGMTKALGTENVIEAVRQKGTDDRMANKIVSEICDKTCSTEDKEKVGCGWDKQGNCIKTVEIRAYDAKHPACKNFKPGVKSLPCPSDVCKKLCNEFKWGQWDKVCCGSKRGEKIEQTRTRPIPDHLFNEQTCPRSEKFICTVEQQCDEVMQLLKAEEEKRAKSWYLICICLMVMLLILAIVAFCCLMTSRRRSAERFQRRLKAAGVSMPAVQDLPVLDERTRNVLADLPLFSTYQASPSSTPSAAAKAKTSAAAAPKVAKSSAAKGGAPKTPTSKKPAPKTASSTKSTKKKI